MKTFSSRSMAAAAFLVLWQASATAAEFTLLIYEPAADIALRAQNNHQSASYWAEYRAFGQELARAKIIRGGAPLDVPATIHAVGNTAARIDTSVSTGLSLGGYFQIEVASLEEALRWAGMAPATRRGGMVEVRPVATTASM